MTPTFPAYALASVAADFVDALTPAERLALFYQPEFWLRPEQRAPRLPWVSCTWIGGRGLGKSYAIACHLNAGVQSGELVSIGLMAPTEDRADEVQIQFLIDTAPPWCRPERYRDGLVWPNGAHATVFTPLAPGRPRSANLHASWLCEIVDWQASTRVEAFNNITTATRIGASPRYYCDTTSKGYNEVIHKLLAQAQAQPTRHHLRRGTIFDNPIYSRDYLRSEVAKYAVGSRAFNEELLGLVFASASGAQWKQTEIDLHRVAEHPPFAHAIVGCDPALTTRADSDESGIVFAGADARGHCYVCGDDSGRHTPQQRSALVVDKHALGAAGAIVETNHLGDSAWYAIEVECRERGLTFRLVERGDPIPQRSPGVFYVKPVHSRQTKSARAEGAAALAQRGLVHHVGRYDALESELVNYEPGGQSPNRYDAMVLAVNELAGLSLDRPAAPATTTTLAAASLNRTLLDRFRGFGDRRL